MRAADAYLVHVSLPAGPREPKPAIVISLSLLVKLPHQTEARQPVSTDNGKISPSKVPDGPRPRRGSPEQTRARLIRTAAQVFNEVPYWETDSNQIAKAAGYSTGTFYRHFKDKREIFIAAYREFVSEEWSSIEANLSPAQTPEQSIDGAAEALVGHHRKWRVFRGNLRALVTYDEELRQLTLELRREQLQRMSIVRRAMGAKDRPLSSDVIHAMMFERVCDAIADDDFKHLGCSEDEAQTVFRGLMREYLLDA